jgi:2-succinyl-6-hydroxy-2,4-cyclohexadiene-1-carboxylate synthase
MAPALVLLHGFTHTGASWKPVIAALGESYRAVAPDIRGHGSASGLEPVTLDAVVGDIAALAPHRFTLGGYSMGGRIALHVALALPERVQRLVLVGASAGIADPDERRVRRQADERLAGEVEHSTIAEFAARWGRTPVLTGQPSSVRAAAHEDRLRSTPAGIARALRGLGAGALPPLWERLGELEIPVVLIVGARDRKFHAIAADMAQRLRRAELLEVPRAGHAVHLEAPAAVAGAIASV